LGKALTLHTMKQRVKIPSALLSAVVGVLVFAPPITPVQAGQSRYCGQLVVSGVEPCLLLQVGDPLTGGLVLLPDQVGDFAAGDRVCVTGTTRACFSFCSGFASCIDVTTIKADRPRAVCTGDCNSDGMVGVDELITGVGLALGTEADSSCRAAYCQPDCHPGPGTGREAVGIECLVRAVGDALHGCLGGVCETDADCGDGNFCTIDTCSGGRCNDPCACD
jgi:hypothetical protein